MVGYAMRKKKHYCPYKHRCRYRYVKINTHTHIFINLQFDVYRGQCKYGYQFVGTLLEQMTNKLPGYVLNTTRINKINDRPERKHSITMWRSPLLCQVVCLSVCICVRRSCLSTHVCACVCLMYCQQKKEDTQCVFVNVCANGCFVFIIPFCVCVPHLQRNSSFADFMSFSCFLQKPGRMTWSEIKY